MKNTILIFLLAFLFSCGNKTGKSNIEKLIAEPKIVNVEKQESEPVIIEETPINQERKDYLGYYVGEFIAVEYIRNNSATYSNKINISIDSLNEKSKVIYGHSVVAGNIRPFSGSYVVDKDKNIKAKVNEPGDDKYDGFFEFILYPRVPNVIGEWSAFDKNLSVTKRKFNLSAKEFKYNPNNNIEISNDWNYPILETEEFEGGGEQEAASYEVTKNNASIKKLKESDVENLSKSDLEIIRNLIYARHGYSFKNRRMRYFFEGGPRIDWYIPVSTDIRANLTKLEKENIALIKRYEEHAEKYYDYFGR